SLSTLKKSPASIPEARVLDMSLSALTSDVAEFATELFGNVQTITGEPNGGAHGFYPRQGDKAALGARVVTLTAQYGCPISALILEDAVGMVQELNNGRMQITEACQAYIEKPEIIHKHMISMSITQYLYKLKADILADSEPRYKTAGPSIGGYGPEQVPKEKVAEETFAQKYARLMQSYNEPARADFEAEFERRYTTPVKQLKAIDKDLAAWYRAQSWLNILTDDYAPEICAAGWAAQMLTVAACVQGGALGEETQNVWATWLKKSDSPAYIGFTGMKTSLLAAVFNLGNVYGNLKTAQTSDEFGNYLKSLAIRKGWASRILAVAGSVSQLSTKLNVATHNGYLAMMQAAMVTAGESTVVLKKNTTLRKLKREIIDNPALHQALSKNNASFEKTGVIGGSAATVDELLRMKGKVLDTPIEVQISAFGTLEQIHTELPHINVNGKPATDIKVLTEFDELFISDFSLQGKGVKGPVVRASYAQIAQWNESGRRYISGDGAGLILGAGLLALQLADWRAKADNLKNSLGTDVDALADYIINRLLVLEGMAKVAGFISKVAVKQNWIVLSEAKQVPGLVRFGAVLGGVAGVVDGIRQWIDAWKDFQAGDTDSSIIGAFSGAAVATAGVISAIWGYQGIFALTSNAWFLGLGPAGWATILLLLGIMLAYEASELRSTAFEIWLRRTCFGIPNESINHYSVWQANSMDDLAEAMVEYYAVVAGMVADVSFASQFDIITGNPNVQSTAYRRVDFRVSMPGWVEAAGGWSISLTSGNGGAILFSQSHNTPGIDDHYQHSGPPGYYKYLWSVDEVKGEKGEGLAINILNLVVSVWTEQSRTPEVTLMARFWPDRSEMDYTLGLTVSAEQE
ncbi:T6SS effector BTH_I2691 family protein, partial [Lelliottia sp. V106_10]|uniref:T6SS effector BTH_I2691 family protein n=1 Tax=Lelliottia wanjuensis TaxID=3050585 RepID=UPI00254CBF26